MFQQRCGSFGNVAVLRRLEGPTDRPHGYFLSPEMIRLLAELGACLDIDVIGYDAV
jgi:hypothetical protein